MTEHTVYLFSQLFSGSSVGHGEFTLTGQLREDGKAEGIAKTVAGAASLNDYKAHLAGTQGLGIIPIDGSKTSFGVIDVDFYSDEQVYNVYKIAHNIQNYLPINIFTSKSGGMHIYVFYSQLEDAKTVRQQLNDLRKLMGLAEDTEIFPKQDKVSKGQFGNWINLPYFGDLAGRRAMISGELDNRYIWAADDAMPVLATRTTTTEQWQQYWDAMPFRDAPPCLQVAIYTDCQDHRNNFLFNFAVYAKKKWADEWEAYVVKMNENFDEPLSERELETTVLASLRKGSYNYQCSQEPLCRFCDKKSCSQRIEENTPPEEKMEDLGLEFGDFVKYEGKEPYYEWVVNGKTLLFRNTQELMSQQAFRVKCVEQLMFMPKLLKEEEWQLILNTALSHAIITEEDYEWSGADAAVAGFREWVVSTATDSRDNIAAGLPWYDGTTDMIVVDARTVIQKLDGIDVRNFNRFMQEEFGAIKRLLSRYGNKTPAWGFALKHVIPDQDARSTFRERLNHVQTGRYAALDAFIDRFNADHQKPTPQILQELV